jgi:hypothetical protein
MVSAMLTGLRRLVSFRSQFFAVSLVPQLCPMIGYIFPTARRVSSVSRYAERPVKYSGAAHVSINSLQQGSPPDHFVGRTAVG